MLPLVPLSKAPDLAEVSAVTHVAPQSAPIAAGIEKHPPTLVALALSEASQFGGCQEVCSGASHGPQNAIQRLTRVVPRPLIAVRGVNQPLVLSGRRQLSVKEFEIISVRLPVLYTGLKDPIKCAAKT